MSKELDLQDDKIGIAVKEEEVGDRNRKIVVVVMVDNKVMKELDLGRENFEVDSQVLMKRDLMVVRRNCCSERKMNLLI